MYNLNGKSTSDNMYKFEKLHSNIVINISTQLYFRIAINPYHMYNAKP